MTETMEMSPLERAARALYVRESPPTDHYAWEDIEEAERDHYRANVRAVLHAIREPSDGMVRDGALTYSNTSGVIAQTTYVWQAMIDAALSE